jgi:hypothetical protein
MGERRHKGTRVWLAIGGICASLSGGLFAANYAVGGIDPFYRSPSFTHYAPAAGSEVAVVHDDQFLPAIGAMATATPDDLVPAVLPPGPAPRMSDADWAAADARDQRAFEREMQLADMRTPEPVQVVDYSIPKLPPVAQPQPQPQAQQIAAAATQPVGPATPNGALIY